METVGDKPEPISIGLFSPARIKSWAETELSFNLSYKPCRVATLVKDVSPLRKQAGPGGIGSICRFARRSLTDPSSCCGCHLTCDGRRSAKQQVRRVADPPQEPRKWEALCAVQDDSQFGAPLVSEITTN
jgi:hypothetical protein